MKTILAILFIISLILVGCNQKEEDEIKPLFKTPDAEAIEKQQQKESRTPKFEEKPVANCALLTKEEGIEFCNLDYEESEETDFSCTQVFRNKTAIPIGVEIKIWDKDSLADAKQKFEHDQNSLKGNLVRSFPLKFTVEDDVKEIIEFVNKRRIVRVSILPKGSCANINKLVSTLVKRT